MAGINLGDTVRDMVTGFEGVAISRVEYLNGCVQFCVKPPIDKDKKMRDGEYIDVHQLVIVSNKQARVEKSETGGAMRDNPSERYTND